MGLNGTYDDDILRAGTEEYSQVVVQTHQRFETPPVVVPPFPFSGISIRLESDECYAIDQLFYKKKLEALEAAASLAQFR